MRQRDVATTPGSRDAVKSAQRRGIRSSDEPFRPIRASEGVSSVALAHPMSIDASEQSPSSAGRRPAVLRTARTIWTATTTTVLENRIISAVFVEHLSILTPPPADTYSRPAALVR